MNNNKTNISFMAFGKGTTPSEIKTFPKYEGIAPFEVLGVNLTKKELEDLGFKQDSEPVYVLKDNNGVDCIKLDFIIRADKEKTGIDLITKATFYIRGNYRQTASGNKQQVIDIYGNTGWVTADEFMAKSTLLTKNDGTKYKAALSPNYRAAHEGEEAVAAFLKTYLSIPNVFAYINGEWCPNPKLEEQGIVPAECVCSFSEEDITAMFKGDFTIIKEAIAGQPMKRVKMLVGTKLVEKVQEDGNTRYSTYQIVYTNKVLYANATKYEYLAKDLENAKFEKNGNNYSKNNISYCIEDIHEVTPKATSLTPSTEPTPTPTTTWGV